MNNGLNGKIYIAGHRGLVGSALRRRLEELGCNNLLYRTGGELDLRNQQAVEEFFSVERPEYVFLAAAKVGGIYANNAYPAEFIYDNLTIQTNVIHASYRYGVKKLLFLGSSCIYPKFAPQPIKEEYLLTGELEPTNEPYAIAKIVGIKMCYAYNRQYGTNFISVMPTNLYGPSDNFNPESSHVLPALIKKFHDAKTENKREVEIWGTGQPKREFMYADDLADACVFLMNNYDYNDTCPFINIGTGKELTIKQLAEIVKNIIGFEGELKFNTDMPDGTPRKFLDSSKLRSLGWQAKTALDDGIKKTYEWFVKNYERGSGNGKRKM
ncbi:NAD-dependent epimerase/dehydratase [Desulfofarcimen acetoxidans DSM 771]|uniref:GDP-L-fucose synthase n=1 Tax=Desulfofarcimen acetoxidans (strain ATCC 49208 / DSM 771 / KCTC 5769 / VKM B-1644 / 5575) TaxID=485916 RepID=C8W1Y6_DESAS|nr:GDP-L-fucose synthase [Desulfofarcimen acetoxidans]ACV63607.1 NAD-dependent epimerase/dehydratase [Desulfofarcimen acetoxidans DSM 771]